MAVTEQMEEYLETIYRLEEEGAVARTGAIATHLGLHPPAVTDMIQKLERAELVEYVPYKGVNLTEKGRAIGKGQLEKHRVMQAFLQHACGMDHRAAHNAACDMEHTIPQPLNDWMEAYLARELGAPFDPQRRVKDQIQS